MLGTTTYGITSAGKDPEAIEMVVTGIGADATASIALFANTGLPLAGRMDLSREMLQGLVSSASRALAQMRVNEDVKVAYGQGDSEFETSYGTPGTAELPTEASGPEVPADAPTPEPEQLEQPAETPTPSEETPDA